jgi:hypothetical protein
VKEGGIGCGKGGFLLFKGVPSSSTRGGTGAKSLSYDACATHFSASVFFGAPCSSSWWLSARTSSTAACGLLSTTGSPHPAVHGSSANVQSLRPASSATGLSFAQPHPSLAYPMQQGAVYYQVPGTWTAQYTHPNPHQPAAVAHYPFPMQHPPAEGV